MVRRSEGVQLDDVREEQQQSKGEGEGGVIDRGREPREPRDRTDEGKRLGRKRFGFLLRAIPICLPSLLEVVSIWYSAP